MRVDNGGVGIEYEVSGEGRPAILLHGFPDTGRLWRNQVPALVDAGFQVITPDLRGYGASAKPDAVDDYNLLLLASDVSAVLDDLGIERAHVVGHDWGSSLAWVVATLLPDRVDHLVVLSVGHPVAFSSVGVEQDQLSWYMLLFQFPGIAEQWWPEHGKAWCNHPDFDAVWADMQRDGSLTPAFNWYRANVPPERYVNPPLQLPPVPAPTMGLWGTDDFALTRAQMERSAEHVSGGFRFEHVDAAGHWLQLDRPDRVNELLLDFLPT